MKRFIITVSFLSLSSMLRASCGLTACDVAHRTRSGEAPWRAEVRVSRAAYDLDSLKGSYLMTALAGDYAGLRGWSLGGSVSMVANSPDAGHHKTGLGNPVLRAEKSFEGWAAGALLELPLGDDEHGLASDHVAAIPYAAWRPRRGAWEADLRAGYSHAFSEKSHDHGAAVGGHVHLLVVNPHENKEVVYRAGALRHGGRVAWGAFLEGQHALNGETKGKGFLTGGASLDADIGRGFSAGLLAETPLARPRRFENRITARVGRAF